MIDAGNKTYRFTPEETGYLIKVGLRALCPEKEIPDGSLVEFACDEDAGGSPQVVSVTVTVSVEEEHIALPGFKKAA